LQTQISDDFLQCFSVDTLLKFGAAQRQSVKANVVYGSGDAFALSHDQLQSLWCKDRTTSVSSDPQPVINVLVNVLLVQRPAARNNCQALAELLHTWRSQPVGKLWLASHNDLKELRLARLVV
jgi:hypothetical protein